MARWRSGHELARTLDIKPSAVKPIFRTPTKSGCAIPHLDESPFWPHSPVSWNIQQLWETRWIGGFVRSGQPVKRSS